MLHFHLISKKKEKLATNIASNILHNTIYIDNVSRSASTDLILYTKYTRNIILAK